MNSSEFGLIITDGNGKILQHNEMIELILKETQLAGKPIRRFSSLLNSLNSQKTIIGDRLAYIVSSSNSSILENVLDMGSTAFAISNQMGNFVFYNTLFLSFFSKDPDEDLLNSNIDDFFQNYCKEWVGLKVVQQAKKEVSIKLTIDGQDAIVLLRPFFFDKKQIPEILISCSYSKEMSLLKKEVSDLQKEIAVFKTESKQEDNSSGPNIVMQSRQMNEIYTLIQNLAPKDMTILLLGKSGTGKSFLARTIHAQSMRKNKQFVTINCSAIPDALIESELFGYEKGAFTGALPSGKKGLVEIANGGTLFLDEIADMPYTMQSKLLQLLQEKTFTPVGSTHTKKADIRIIAATNKDLPGAIKNGSFREDLYYRIAVAVVNIPPLSDRKEDLEGTINAFLDYYNRKHNKKISFTQHAKNNLVNYSWPGNIRELEHLLEFLVLCADHDIDACDLPYHIIQEVNPIGSVLDSNLASNSEGMQRKVEHVSASSFDLITTFDDAVEEYKRHLVEHFYETYSSSYKLAKKFSISQTKANQLIQKYICKKATT